ncbi:MAG: hypothetical protein Q8N84_01790 [bacterium]|nr:hypothetical protein [bacterium]
MSNEPESQKAVIIDVFLTKEAMERKKPAYRWTVRSQKKFDGVFLAIQRISDGSPKLLTVTYTSEKGIPFIAIGDLSPLQWARLHLPPE